MAQEFTIKSEAIETKINQLLPTQGGFQPGVDFSASTMVIPIVDLTESAEGGTTRQDLQSALSLGSVTAHFFTGAATSTLQNTPGYWRVFGQVGLYSGNQNNYFDLTDGTTTKIIWNTTTTNTSTTIISIPVDFIVYLTAGVSLRWVGGNTNQRFGGCSRQIADISGNLVNPV